MKGIHVGVLIPRLRVQPDGTGVVVDQAGAVFVNEAEHRRTSGLRGINHLMAKF